MVAWNIVNNNYFNLLHGLIAVVITTIINKDFKVMGNNQAYIMDNEEVENSYKDSY